MTRRLLPSLIMLLALTGCAEATTPPANVNVVAVPTDPSTLVLGVRFVGGFLPAGSELITPPRLAVYGDRRAIANTDKVLRLSPDELAAVVGSVREDLAGLDAFVSPDPNDPYVADAASTQIDVWGDYGRRVTVTAYALEILPSYPKRLRDARDLLTTLADRVLAEGTDFTAERVRLVAQPRPDLTTGRPWPTGVPVPPTTGPQSEVRSADMSGASARAIIMSVPGEARRTVPWTAMRLPNGQIYGVSWRYLLPDE